MRAIYCAGEQARVVLDILRSREGIDDLVFLDDDASRHGDSVDGFPVVGTADALEDIEKSIQCLVAFGDEPGVRLELAQKIADSCEEFFNAIHPDVTVSDTATIGSGITINARSYLGPGVVLHDHVIVDSCVNVSHDVRIQEGATITPNATLAGGVTVGRDVYLGPGATVVEDVRIEEEAVVGAGAVVTEDVTARKTVVGVPAEPI